MHGHRLPYRPGGHGRPPQQQQQVSPQPQLQNYNPNLSLHDPKFYHLQNPNTILLQQNFNNSTVQNPNFPFQNPNLCPPLHQHIPSPQQPQPHSTPQQKQNWRRNKGKQNKELLERIDRTVVNARSQLVAAREHVSSWIVSQSVLMTLQAESWTSLGFQMQDIPSLNRLIVTEAKINAFIHCFVAVRRISTIYDLAAAICENEGVETFEELELGPILKHPLVVHYFPVIPGVTTEVFKITIEEVILGLCQFMDACNGKAIFVNDFLNFLAQKYLVRGPEMLGLRVLSLGMHISFIQQAKGLENVTLKKCQETLATKYGGRIEEATESADATLAEIARSVSYIRGQRPLLSSLEKKNRRFCGKHIRFVSSSSDDVETDDSSTDEDNITSTNVASQSGLSSHSSDRVSNCPYPSASEEMSRLGLVNETRSQISPAIGSSQHKMSNRSFRKKRKLEDTSRNASAPAKLIRSNKKHIVHPIENVDKIGEIDTLTKADISLSNPSMRAFISTWKETCKECNVGEVLEKMLPLYTESKLAARQRKRIKKLFLSYPPLIGFLNVAVSSIKYGMWDSIYDAFQTINQLDSNALPAKCSEYECIEVEPSQKSAPVVSEHSVQQKNNLAGTTVEEIIGKVAQYYGLDRECLSNGKTILENKLISLRKLSSCELWLVDQFGVKDFKSLGYGEFFFFLEKHASLFPTTLQKLLVNDGSEKFPLEVSMLQHQLMILVSEASINLWENQTITKQMIAALLTQQFPLLSFKIVENGSMEDFRQIVGKYKNDAISNRVIYSATLLGTRHIGESLPHKEDCVLATIDARNNCNDEAIAFHSVTSKEAIDVLLRAPMLSDLQSWSHWDLIFASSLGPLIGWLLSEVNAKELLCLVTKDGKVIRIDQSATADSFLEAALQRSSFQTAVKLLSLFSSAGGENHVPLSLLKCYASHAFEVILKNYAENTDAHCSRNYILPRKGVGKTSNDMAVELQNNPSKINQAVSVASRFVLDCLGYMPSEFHGFAADVLLSGMQSVIKEASSFILYECNQKERLMLHEIGFSRGIIEWIDDYHAFFSNVTTDLSVSSGSSCLEAVRAELSTGSGHMQNKLGQFSYANSAPDVTLRENVHNEACIHSSDAVGSGCMEQPSDFDLHKDAALVIESIREEEFGLESNLSNSESGMLKKQHARLGRALHCLSQELYSQDSHFLLELVQNADDNVYPEDVEPTLTFLLQESGIVVLNNERGFSAENIRALCDVGNSTKKGSGGGYIGQKGIGFKSVFRITDAPEIHSNGFHIKFDIGEGQIGFVLPTIVPACDINFFGRLVSIHPDQMDTNSWNTCIVLPFRSKLSEETAMKMFSDLHPSLLLFLQRLQCIMFRNMLNDSLIIMKKEIMEDGIIRVSFGKDEMSWLLASQKLEAHASRPKVQKTEIAIAFTLEESDSGEYIPRLDQQPVFSYLPLRTYGLKFILQGDFILPSSREEVDKNNPWNEWLLTKFPALFVSAERSFCVLPCFRENPGKAVAAYMSFVPLVGEVHGFFSGLPKAIALELQRTSCLLLEGDSGKMVPPCNVLRGWDEQARNLLPDSLLQEHLGLGLLDKNIVLSDSLARALGIKDYGPEILIKFMTHLCRTENGLKSMGMGWLSSWLNTLYTMLTHSSGQTDVVDSLNHIPFIPLSDGTYSSLDMGTIWLHTDAISIGFDHAHGLQAFPKLLAKLRIVNPTIFSASAADGTLVDNISRMLHRIGVQKLSAHEIIKVHILQAISDDRTRDDDKDLMIDYLCFVMIHLLSGCPNCCAERKHIISELQNKAYILTNHGFRRLVDTSIHFSREFGNPIDASKLINKVNMRWHEVDISYLQHPANELLSNGLIKWREFFKEIGITDFVHVVQIDKNIADLYHTVFKNVAWDTDPISPGSTAKDWESHELVNLLSLLSTSGDVGSCKYLLEVLDKLWDDNFSDKATGCYDVNSNSGSRHFKSSFISKMCDVRWLVSSMDNELHYPRDLFYDCDAVRSILGASAPYALPKVRSEKLLGELGFKTEVTIHDALEILNVWRESEAPFKASIAQMSKFYTFIWDQTSASKNKVSEAFRSGPFIFVPFKSGPRHEDLVPGVFLSIEDVYWHDPTGAVDHIDKMHAWGSLTSVIHHKFSKTLCNVYPGLHDFFVNECGVFEIPTCRSYLHILQQLSTVVDPPSQAASAVFQVFLKWAEALKSGFLSSEDIHYFKERLSKSEYKVLPTVLDKWVSLNSSHGVVCWSDDTKLRNSLRYMKKLDFLYFSNLSDSEQEMLQAKVYPLMQILGIPALSEIIFREAVPHGQADSSFKSSLINWALPYAQRYIYSLHPDKYFQLKQSQFDNLKKLEIIAVEKLSYKNVIKTYRSKKEYECSCLLQGNTLYTTVKSDSHALFLELSRLFFDGSPDLHFANFLHMITTMAESGSTEQQTEFFILNSQKVAKLPVEEPVWFISSTPEPVWSLSLTPSLTKDHESVQRDASLTAINESKPSNSNQKAGNDSSWPPMNWKTAPGFDYARANGFKTQAAMSCPSSSYKTNEEDSKEIVTQTESIPVEIDMDWTTEEETAALISPEPETATSDPVVLSLASDGPAPSSSRYFRRDQQGVLTAEEMQAKLTGRLGEEFAFKYFSENSGKEVVRWVNQDNETGCPYDIVVGGEESNREYIEVKATRLAKKNWFKISTREWQFAAEKGESFSIAHVVILGNNIARLTIFRNPFKQCLLGNLHLVLMLSKEQSQLSIASGQSVHF